MSKYDVVVIGAGPGGYVAAIRAAQLGHKVACIDSWVNMQGEYALGGTCLNVGCIPSKALLDSSHRYHELLHEFDQHGIHAGQVDLDVKKMLARKNKIVTTLTSGIETLFLKHKIDWLKGRASFENPQTLTVATKDATLQVTADHIVIATGSQARIPTDYKLDGDKVVDSSGALILDHVPNKLCVLGGGIIGLELGSVWNRLGAKTTVLVRGDKFLPTVDQQLATLMFKDLQQQGLDIRLSAKVTAHSVTEQGVSIDIQDSEGEQEELFDTLLICFPS
jgi:dihydrolipoamide dehydrogenase